jgi:hypothetical protein
MPVLLEIPSGGPTDDGGDGFLWGDGGTGFIYWCDECKVSSLGMQGA